MANFFVDKMRKENCRSMSVEEIADLNVYNYDMH
eukprot:CAMPEP_0116904354 /NCGR_PEP_ID=MMETSP0467-20121206/11369_1 /TAXON_ID=283647 /ORGANISM="Mesodinium pulex, Strain SPMC105" /LENGTH=33 /DNA_ID= /DNA_START= /DNA_END= /DNA_ORIENTATION=